MFESGYVYEGDCMAFERMFSCFKCHDLIKAYFNTLEVYYGRFGAIMPIPVRKGLLEVLSSRIQDCDHEH